MIMTLVIKLPGLAEMVPHIIEEVASLRPGWAI